MGFFDKKIEGKTANEWWALAKSTEDNHLKIKYNDNVLKLNNSFADSWFDKGKALVALNNAKDAGACFHQYLKIVEADPSQYTPSLSVMAYYLMGVCVANLGNNEGGVKLINIALDQSEKIIHDQKLLNLTNFSKDEMVSALLEIIETKWKICIASSQWAEAEKCIDMRIKYNPKDIEALDMKAGVFKDSKKYYEAIQLYNKILDVDPTNELALFHKTECFSEQKQYSEAIQIINSAPFHSNSILLLEKKGEILRKIGKYEEALDTYKKVLKINPGDTALIKNIEKLDEMRRNEQNPPHKISQNFKIPDSISDNPIELLRTILKDHDISIINSPSKFSFILKDYFKGDYKKEENVLIKSVEENIPQDLLAKKKQLPFSLLSSQLARRLKDCGFSNELATWAVNAWAMTLELETKTQGKI